MARPELGRDRGQLRPRLERPLLRVAPLRIVDSLLGRIDVDHPPDDSAPEHFLDRLRLSRVLSQVLIDELTERQGTPAAALTAHPLQRPLERLTRVPLGRETTPLHTSRAATTHPITKRPPSLNVAATAQPEHLTFLQHHDHSSRPIA